MQASGGGPARVSSPRSRLSRSRRPAPRARRRRRPSRSARLGPNRAAAPYAERSREAKAALLARINANRPAVGAPPVEVDVVAARGGRRVLPRRRADGRHGPLGPRGSCAVRSLRGRGRRGLARRELQRVVPAGAVLHPDELVGVLLEAHGRMMAEKPPDDGHRRTVLDPRGLTWGSASPLEGGEFRMTEEFTRHVGRMGRASGAEGARGRGPSR